MSDPAAANYSLTEEKKSSRQVERAKRIASLSSVQSRSKFVSHANSSDFKFFGICVGNTDAFKRWTSRAVNFNGIANISGNNKLNETRLLISTVQ